MSDGKREGPAQNRNGLQTKWLPETVCGIFAAAVVILPFFQKECRESPVAESCGTVCLIWDTWTSMFCGMPFMTRMVAVSVIFRWYTVWKGYGFSRGLLFVLCMIFTQALVFGYLAAR